MSLAHSPGRGPVACVLADQNEPLRQGGHAVAVERPRIRDDGGSGVNTPPQGHGLDSAASSTHVPF